jgi:hypothetical protein
MTSLDEMNKHKTIQDLKSTNFANAEQQTIISEFPFKDHPVKVTLGQLPGYEHEHVARSRRYGNFVGVSNVITIIRGMDNVQLRVAKVNISLFHIH